MSLQSHLITLAYLLNLNTAPSFGTRLAGVLGREDVNICINSYDMLFLRF